MSTALPERPHPDDPAYRGNLYENLMRERYQYAEGYVRNRSVLDVGCGTCWGWSHLRTPDSLTGVDYSADALREARRLGFADRVVCAELHQLPFPADSFDAILCLDAIEHVTIAAAREFLAECRRLLRPDGLLVLSTPLRRRGRHSTNPFHFMEYSREELLSLLGEHFHVFDQKFSELNTESLPPVFLCACRLLPEPAPAGIRWTVPQFGNFARAELEAALPQPPTSAQQAAIRVLLAEALGRPDILERHRSAILARLCAEELAARLQPDADQLAGTESCGSHACLIFQAVDALHGLPELPLSFLEAFRDEGYHRTWLEGLEWKDAEPTSGRVAILLSGLLLALFQQGFEWAADRFHSTLDWLESRLDPATGLWGTKQEGVSVATVCATARLLPFFLYARRPLCGVTKRAASALSLLNEYGTLVGRRDPCSELLVIALLCDCYRGSGPILPELRASLIRAFWAQWNWLAAFWKDVSSPKTGPTDFPPPRAYTQAPDALLTLWMRLCALHRIRSVLGDDLPPIGSWTFRRLPGPGFHLRDNAIPPDAPPEHRPIWFRPLPAPPEPAEPRVSVVVTCYNLGQYLYESLSSVCRQTLQEIETVIVDDGSTDPYTIARLDDLAEAGWRVLRTENRGLPAARNLGIQNTRAPFICCLDADDRLHADYLRKAAATLEANPRAGFVSCFYELFDEASGVYRYPRPRLPRMLARNEAVGTSVFRREAWTETGGYCESLPAMQDWDFWISILEKGWEAEQLPEPLFDYRIRAGSMYSGTRKPARFSRVSSLIHARHAALYQRYLAEVLHLQARFFAEHVEFSRRQETAWEAEARQLRRQLLRLQQPQVSAPGEPEPAPEPAPEPEPAPAPAALPPPRPSLGATLTWVLPQVLHPRQKWRGLRNLLLLMKVLATAELRSLWYSLFDPFEYCRRRPDVANRRIHASVHFALAGAWEGVDASPRFLSSAYWQRHADVSQAGLNPLLHFVVFGSREGRMPLPASMTLAHAEFPAEMLRPGVFTAAPAVSVVIPCFNLGRYVEEAVFSVLRQTLSGIEIIVVDGGSTDAETCSRLRLLERAAFPGVRILRRERPAMAGDNRNFGIREARGRHICCLDADDILDPAYLECALFTLEFGDADFAFPCTQEFGAASVRWMTSDPQWPDVIRVNTVSTVALFRREIWEQTGGFRDWGLGAEYVPEDWDFWIRAVAAGFSGKALRECLMHYRVRPNSLSRKGTRGLKQFNRRMSEVNAGLLQLDAPPPRPCPAFGRLSWSCLEAAPQPTVLMVIPFFTVGGAERIFLSLFREWRRRGVRIVVATTLRLAEHIPDRIDQVRSFTPHVYPLAHLFEGRDDLQAGFLYFLLRRYQPSFIFTAGSDFFYRLLPAVRDHFPDIPVIDQLFNDQVHLPTNRACARFIDCTSVPNERFARRLIEEFGESPERVAVVRQCIRWPRPSRQRPPSGWPAEFTGRPVVGFFGRLSAEKAPLDFVKIARRIADRLPRTRFVMAGDGPDLAAVRGKIRKLGLEGIVHAAGFVAGVHDWMDACDLTILCSTIDGMPLAVLEAQALGKPVVASRVGSVPEMIVDGVTGVLCKPGDIEAFTSAAVRLLEDEELRRRMGTAGRERMHQEFREEIMIEQYFRLFDRVCGLRRDRRV